MAIFVIKQASPSIAVFVLFLIASVISTLIFGGKAISTLKDITKELPGNPHVKREAAKILVAGVSLGLSVYLQTVKRTTFAPSGSDVAFLLVFAPLFAILLVGFGRAEKLSWEKIAGSLAAVLGTIAIVGNWERPSSFSPFSLFIVPESFVLASAFFMAAFAVLSKKLVGRYPANRLAPILIWIAACTVAVPMFTSQGGLMEIPGLTLDNWIFLAAIAVFAIIPGVFSMLDLLSAESVSTSVSSLHLLPVLVTALIGVEKALDLAYMSTPFEWLPIIIGSITVLSGVGVIWLGGQEVEHGQVTDCTATKECEQVTDRETVVGYDRYLPANKTAIGILIILAVAGIVWSGISFFCTYKTSFISGSLDTGQHFETSFRSLRCSSVGGYSLLLACVVNLLLSLDILKKRVDIKRVLILALFSATLLVMTVLTGNTPIITWFADIPSDIQHSIGTPYASLTETMSTCIPWYVAIGFSCLFVIFLTIYIAVTSKAKAEFITVHD
jgi:drug/metabolite transporter (DMT)-like permease